MRTFGYFLLESRGRATLALVACTALATILPVFSSFLIGVPLALVALRKGVLVAAQVALPGLLVSLLFTLALNITPALPLTFLATIWIPVLLCSFLLRQTGSQGMVVLYAGVSGLVFNATLHVVAEELQDWWQDVFQRVRDYGSRSELEPEQLEQFSELIMSLLPAIFASGFVVSLVVTMLLARWWQAALFNPGGFREEFHALRLPRAVVFATLLGLLLLLLAPASVSTIIRDSVLLLLILYLFQGLSVMHYYFHTRGIPRIGSIGMYGTFFVLPQFILLFVTCVGLVNACLGWVPARVTDKKS